MIKAIAMTMQITEVIICLLIILNPCEKPNFLIIMLTVTEQGAKVELNNINRNALEGGIERKISPFSILKSSMPSFRIMEKRIPEDILFGTFNPSNKILKIFDIRPRILVIDNKLAIKQMNINTGNACTRNVLTTALLCFIVCL